ncbi:hypothetical protein TNCV_580241 [Trichonephila clavipes]|nr:hypothetical protein TNCV_580241 [Trichonephila clavipes]
MPSPVRVQCECSDDTICKSGRVRLLSESMGHAPQVCVRIVLPPPPNVLATVFERSAFPEAARNLIYHLLSCGAPVPFADRADYILSSAGVVLLTRPPRCRLLHIPVVLNDFHSRETTL